MSPVFRCAQVCARLYATIPKHKSTYCNNRYFLCFLTRVPKALLTFPAGMHMKKKKTQAFIWVPKARCTIVSYRLNFFVSPLCVTSPLETRRFLLLQARPLQCTCTKSSKCQSVTKQLGPATKRGGIPLGYPTWLRYIGWLQKRTARVGSRRKISSSIRSLWQFDKAPCEHACTYVTRGAVAVCLEEGCDSSSHVAVRCWDWEADAQWQLPPRSHRPAQSHCRW